MRFPRSIYDSLTLLGYIFSSISLLVIIILFAVSMLFGDQSPYLGLFLYIILPVFLVFGLILIPVGMFFKARMIRKSVTKESLTKWPVLDLNDRKQRRSIWFVIIATFFFIIISSVGSYDAFHYTESVQFCGILCHKVMEPEYSAYQNSPHARVACVECHVGQGASWYVKSKLSGLYQVYSVIFHKYAQPIATPITNLRPARETCEKCHWPQKFYGQTLQMQKNFLADSLNTEWDYGLQMKIGPSMQAYGLIAGIHWHINPSIKIEYIANSRDRESIPWVRFTNLKTNEVTIFQDDSNKLTRQAMDTLPLRVMDCMDCHNRPSHVYKSPSTFINEALTTGKVPKELPFIKFVSMKYLKEVFTDNKKAIAYIEDSIPAYYKNNLPSIYSTQKKQIDKAVAGIKEEFFKNEFPYMRVKWDAYPNHIGHIESDGCFRCHSDKHKSTTGKVISKNCDLCHSIVVQGKPNQIEVSSVLKSLAFRHPKDIGEDWKTYFCTECHRALY